MLFLTAFCLQAAEDSITLNSGEVMEGRIVSITDTQVEIEVHNKSRTIFTTRTVPRSEIKEVHKLTDAQRRQAEAYEAITRYRLNPNLEFASAYCAQAIAACDKFLAAYPDSEYTPKVTEQRAEWQFEKREVEQGRVKFAGKWMTPDEKKPLLEELLQQQAEQKVQNQARLVKAARARVVAAHKEHDFLHSEAGYKGKVLPEAEYDRVMLRYKANDEEIPKAEANLDAAMTKFDELYGEYQRLGGKVNYREQIDGK